MRGNSILKSDIDTYHRASPCRPTRRLVTALIDFFILVAVSLIMYIATYNVTIQLGGYKAAAEKVSQEVEYYNDYIGETHLVEFATTPEGKRYRIEVDEVAFKTFIANVKFSYEHDKNNEFNKDYDVVEKLKDFNSTSPQNDHILYFLSVYLPAHNTDNCILDMQGKTPQEYYAWCLEKSAGETFFDEHFLVDDETGIPYIKPYVANKIIGFLFYDDTSSNSQTFYNNVWQVYINVTNDLETVMLQNETYQTNHYIPYENAKIEQSIYIAVSLIINLAISYLLAIVLPQILFKDGRTFARKIFNVGVISRKLGEVKWYQILGRCIFGFFGSFPSLYLIPLLPIFNFEYYTFNVPFFKSGDFYINLGHFILIFGIIAAVNAILVPILKKRTTVVDLATQCYVVDGRYLDEIDYEEPRYKGE